MQMNAYSSPMQSLDPEKNIPGRIGIRRNRDIRNNKVQILVHTHVKYI
jgi:hypothetical protein